VTLHGFVPDAELDRALDAAQMALNLRYPTKGEASYSQLRIWSHSLPSLVTRIGWYAEQPADTVSFVRPHFMVQDICTHLRAFAAGPGAYLESGRRGYEYLVERHSPRRYAAKIVEIAGQSAAYRKDWNARRMGVRAVEERRGWFPAEELDGRDRLAAAIGELTDGQVKLSSKRAGSPTTAAAANRAAIPPVPEGLDIEQLFAAVPSWHQRWEIFQNVFTPGRNPIATLMARAGVPPMLTGKRVLDIGAYNCCCSFECERRGASEVVAFDLQDPAALGFPVLREALGSSRVRFEQGSVYNLDPETLGKFDVILFFGVLYHLRYPLLALDQLRKVARGKIYIETLVIDHRFLEGGRDLQELASYHPALTEVPLWQFYKSNEMAGDYSNWFGPNIRAVLDAFESAGLPAELMGTWGDRAAFQASPGRGHIGQSYEGMSEMVRQQMGLYAEVEIPFA
jgi:tRNA (mo5U34)-methyltransferase